ncbi:alpha/beta hydrolase [Sphingomonas sp. MG17]|uniref:Alpha/beta hydrolase n=1 Tax=Sphingomonas tagetis TaxID=2949092 RepID=A0A9X2KK94_9SPHN|nr:alpha/beta hydrolase [Sphingomonas tagetis]MCP3730299.1 alpha/beta hydrolase [Sphingomonas tagetis]
MQTRRTPLAQKVRDMLQARSDAGVPDADQLTPEQLRAAIASAGPLTAIAPVDIGDIRDIEIEGPGGKLALRCYRSAQSSDGSAPALLFFHGGGWMTGGLDSHDGICRYLCRELGFPVIAVDYRLAPEHPFPAAIEDAFAAARWVFNTAAQLGIDPARIAVGGDSAGGNLAAVLGIAGARGDLPRFAYQMLFYPVTDLSSESAGYRRVADGVPISGRTLRWFWKAYLSDPADALDWRASPLLASSLAGTPPCFVVTAEHDPLAEEGADFARRLIEAEVEVTHLHYSHHLHAFLGMGGVLREAKATLVSAAAAARIGLNFEAQALVPVSVEGV